MELFTPDLTESHRLTTRTGSGPVEQSKFFKTVLVVEDDTDIYPIYERLLRRVDKDIAINWATTANEALTLLEEVRYDALVSDIVLPNLMNGVDLWYQIRDQHPGMNVVLTSAIGTNQFIKMFKEEKSCPKFLAKPFDIDQCTKCFSELLRTRTYV